MNEENKKKVEKIARLLQMVSGKKIRIVTMPDMETVPTGVDENGKLITEIQEVDESKTE